MIKTIAFDADDTLWHTEHVYARAQARYVEILKAYGLEEKQALDTLHRIEVDNLPEMGYGIKAFVLSMIESAVALVGDRMGGKDVQVLLDEGRAMIRSEIQLLEHTQATVMQLAERYPLMLVTKGDLLDQERKVLNSGLGPFFELGGDFER